jgi:hypothetical protein
MSMQWAAECDLRDRVDSAPRADLQTSAAAELRVGLQRDELAFGRAHTESARAPHLRHNLLSG